VLPSDHYAVIYAVFALSNTSYAKQALVAKLQAEYSTIAALNTAWGTTFTSFGALTASPYTFPSSPSAKVLADLSSMLSAYATQYYTVVRTALKTADPNHLYLGSRFDGILRAPAEVVQACATVCDVVSLNWYKNGMDPQIWATYGAAGHPALISEYRFASVDRGVWGGGPGSVLSEAQRASNYTAYMQSIANNPDFVGMQWFSYMDNPATGAAYGPPYSEDFHGGFVSVTDTPWTELVTAATQANQAIYTTRQP
jgi:agarase